MSYNTKLNEYRELRDEYSSIIDIIERNQREVSELVSEMEIRYSELFAQLSAYTEGSSGHLTQTYDNKLEIVKVKAKRIYLALMESAEKLDAQLKTANEKRQYYADKADTEARRAGRAEASTMKKNISSDSAQVNSSQTSQIQNSIVRGRLRNDMRI